MSKQIKGILFDWNETGTEGPVWAIQDEDFIDPNAKIGGWSYEGLHTIDNSELPIIHDHVVFHTLEGMKMGILSPSEIFYGGSLDDPVCESRRLIEGLE